MDGGKCVGVASKQLRLLEISFKVGALKVALGQRVQLIKRKLSVVAAS